MNRLKLLCALFILLVSFAILTASYMKARGRILPPKLKAITITSFQLHKKEMQESKTEYRNNMHALESLLTNVVKAIGKLTREISNNLMYFFVPAWLLGLYSLFIKKSVSTNTERFIVTLFIVFNIGMMIMLYVGWQYISRRHCMPLVVFTVFYVPLGLQIFADRLAVGFSRGQQENNQKSHLWLFILIMTGLALCIPKLLKPIRTEKKAYKAAAQWLKENTRVDNLIAVPDKRILFYAERKGLVYEENIPSGVEYALKVTEGKDEKPDVNKAVRKELSLWIDQRKKTKKIVIYRVL